MNEYDLQYDLQNQMRGLFSRASFNNKNNATIIKYRIVDIVHGDGKKYLYVNGSVMVINSNCCIFQKSNFIKSTKRTARYYLDMNHSTEHFDIGGQVWFNGHK